MSIETGVMTRILVIDDQSLWCEEIVDILIYDGYEAQGALDGLTGMALAIEYQPDLILCDDILPRLDGYGVLKELRATPSTQHIRFIIMSVCAHQQERAKASGANGYVTKPFTHKSLLGAIQACLNDR